MEDLQYHMARMLFQLNECRNFHEEKGAHGRRADISHPFLDKLNKRIQSVCIAEPKSPRTIIDSDNDEGSLHKHTHHAPVSALPPPPPIINSSEEKNTNGDEGTSSSEASSMANNVHTISSSTNFVASRRSKTFEPNKLKKKKQKCPVLNHHQLQQSKGWIRTT